MTTLTVPKPSSCATTHDAAPRDTDWQAGFSALLPEIERRLRFLFRGLEYEAREEAVQDATCLACRDYARLVSADRAHVATAASLAGYATAQYRAGRRLGSPLNVNDVCSEHCRLRKHVVVERLDWNEGGSWREALVEDWTVTPADLAASRIDYPAFLLSLSPVARSVAEALGSGETTGGAARRFGVSAGRVSQLRRELHDAWWAFHGEVAAR